jgi:TPR repeat protein
LLKAAADLNVADAVFELGQLRAEGLFVAQDDATAIWYFERADELGHLDAAMALARIYHRRLDFASAKRYYTRAIDVCRADQKLSGLLASERRWWPSLNPE